MANDDEQRRDGRDGDRPDRSRRGDGPRQGGWSSGPRDFERREGQRFVVDLVLGLDTRPAAASDDLADTVDYGTLVERVRVAVENDPVDLIETLADRIAHACFDDRRVAHAVVTVHKPSAPIAVPFADVSVTVQRARLRHGTGIR